MASSRSGFHDRKSTEFQTDPTTVARYGDALAVPEWAARLRCGSEIDFVVSGLGPNVTALEDDQKLQDLALSVHHATILTFNSTPAVKIIENDRGVSYINTAQMMLAV